MECHMAVLQLLLFQEAEILEEGQHGEAWATCKVSHKVAQSGEHLWLASAGSLDPLLGFLQCHIVGKQMGQLCCKFQLIGCFGNGIG